MIAKPTRGEKNKNPANIVWTDKIHWQGQIPDFERTDARFCQFETDVLGLRALCRALLNYQRLDGCKTLADVVNRWAPPVENDTGAYVVDVAVRTGIAAEEPLDLTVQTTLVNVARAIIWHENGRCTYDTTILTQAALAALR